MATENESITVIDSLRIEQARSEGVPLIDVRPAFMFDQAHIPGAVNVPLVNPEDGSMIPDESLVAAIEKAGVKPEDDVVLYCQTGLHAGLAADTLASKGFTDVEVYSGSMNDWSAQGLPTE